MLSFLIQSTQAVVIVPVSIGSTLAVVICWGRTNSVLVSAFAGLFGWLYVFMYVFFIRPKEERDGE
jgi:hypothetical protein